MILSVGASAQDDGIAHRFPAVNYKATVSVNGVDEELTFTLPAWDAYNSDRVTDENNVVHYYESGYRMQLIENPGTDKTIPVKVKIVGYRAMSNETTNLGDYWYASLASGKVKIKNFNGVEEEKSVNSWKYSDIFGIVGQTNEDGKEGIIAADDKNQLVFNILKTESQTGNFTIQKERKIQGGKWKDYTFKVTEIGEAAFRNGAPIANPTVFKVTETVTIPNTIEKIENNAFRNGIFKKLVFEEGSQLETIEKATFEGNRYLEEVHIPASVTKIVGTAFGSCEKLNKVVFEGNIPVMTIEPEEPDYEKNNTKYGPYNIFEGAKRLQHAGTTGKDVTPAKCLIQVPVGTAKSYLEATNVDFTQFPMSSKQKMTSSGLMTFCCDNDFTFKKYDPQAGTWSNGDVKAYFVDENGVNSMAGKIVLTEIPYNDDLLIRGWKSDNDDFGIVIKGTPNGEFDIFYPYGDMTNLYSVSDEETNCLKGVITPTDIIINSQCSYYILSGGKFYRVVTNGQCKANRAYVMIADGGYTENMDDPYENGGGARELEISFPEETGIATIETKNAQNDAWYTLQGIQVNQPQKGIFIKNGKKFVIK